MDCLLLSFCPFLDFGILFNPHGVPCHCTTPVSTQLSILRNSCTNANFQSTMPFINRYWPVITTI